VRAYSRKEESLMAHGQTVVRGGIARSLLNTSPHIIGTSTSLSPSASQAMKP
jgi:hypothetical protein